jgi:hypothetical protein
MTNENQSNTSGDNTISGRGWPNFFMEIGRTFGVPTLLLFVISYWLLWQVTPPIVTMFQEFITSTLATQLELAKTQAEIAESQRKIVILVEDVSKAAKQIITSNQSSERFMLNVEQQHTEQIMLLKKNNDILEEWKSVESKKKASIP